MSTLASLKLVASVQQTRQLTKNAVHRLQRITRVKRCAQQQGVGQSTRGEVGNRNR